MDETKQKKKYEMDMCSGPLMKKLVAFSLPLILSSNLQLLFNAVDIIVVGSYSGQSALAAVGSTTALINLLITLFMGVSLGTNVLAGRFFATGDKKGMEETVHTSMAFAILSGIAVGIAGIAFSRWALVAMDTPPNILEQALLYIRIYFLGMPFFMLYNYGAAILRAVGDTKRPLWFLVIAGIINTCLNLLLVIVFHLGVAGVAIATVFSEMVSCILVLRCLVKTDGSYRLHFSRMKINFHYLMRLCRIGLPAGIQSLVINFSNVLLQSSVNSFGDTAMAGYTAANNIFGFLYVTVNAFSQTCMSFMSQNFGAKKLRRMDRVFWDCMGLSVGVMLVLGCGSYVFGEYILRIYTPDADVIACGMEIFLYTTSTYFICGIMDLFPGAMRAMGYSTVPMLLSVIGTVGVRLFWIWCVFPSHHRLDILFISYPLSWAVTVVMQLVCYWFVRRKVHKQFGEASLPA